MAENKKVKAFRSCFISDVQVGTDRIRLQDTARNFYFIDINDAEVVNSFRTWFQTVFLKGAPQTTTVFRYEQVIDDDCSPDLYVKKFILKKEDAQNQN